MVSTLLVDMKHSGAHLSKTSQDQLASLTSQIADLEAQFYTNISSPAPSNHLMISKEYVPFYDSLSTSMVRGHFFLTTSQLSTLIYSMMIALN